MSLLSLGFADWAKRAEQCAPGICLSPPLQGWAYKHTALCWLLTHTLNHTPLTPAYVLKHYSVQFILGGSYTCGYRFIVSFMSISETHVLEGTPGMSPNPGIDSLTYLDLSIHFHQPKTVQDLMAQILMTPNCL